MLGERRSVGKMPKKRRHLGKTALERRAEVKMWTTIVGILTLLAALAANPANAQIIAAGVALVGGLIAAANTFRQVVWGAYAPVDHVSLAADYHSLSALSHTIFNSRTDKRLAWYRFFYR